MSTVPYGPRLPASPTLPQAPKDSGSILRWARDLTVAVAAAYRTVAVRADSLTFHGALADRPAAVGSRRIYRATDTGEVFYDQGDWVLIVSSGGPISMSVDETPAGTIDGVNAVFTLASAPAGGKMFLYVSSIGKCWPGVTYNLAGNVITFTAGNIPVTGDLISATYPY